MNSEFIIPNYADDTLASRWEHIKAYLTYTIGFLAVAQFFHWLRISKSDDLRNLQHNEMMHQLAELRAEHALKVEELRETIREEYYRKYQVKLDYEMQKAMSGPISDLKVAKNNFDIALKEKDDTIEILEEQKSQLSNFEKLQKDSLRQRDGAMTAAEDSQEELQKRLADSVKEALQLNADNEGYRKTINKQKIDLEMAKTTITELQHSKKTVDDREIRVKAQLAEVNAKGEGTSDRLREKDEEIKTLGEALEAEKLRRAQVENARTKDASEKHKLLESEQAPQNTKEQLAASSARVVELELSLSQKDDLIQATSRQLKEANKRVAENDTIDAQSLQKLKKLEAELSHKERESSQLQTDIESIYDKLNKAKEHDLKQIEEIARWQEMYRTADNFRTSLYPQAKKQMLKQKELGIRRDADLKAKTEETDQLISTVTKLQASNTVLNTHLAAKETDAASLRKNLEKKNEVIREQEKALDTLREKLYEIEKRENDMAKQGDAESARQILRQVSDEDFKSEESINPDVTVAPQVVQSQSSPDTGVAPRESASSTVVGDVHNSNTTSAGMGRSKYAPAAATDRLYPRNIVEDGKVKALVASPANAGPTVVSQSPAAPSSFTTDAQPFVPTASVFKREPLSWDPPPKPENFNTTDFKVCRYCSVSFNIKDKDSRAQFHKHIPLCQQQYRTCGNEGCGKIMTSDHFYNAHLEQCKKVTAEKGLALYDAKSMREKKEARDGENRKNEETKQSNKQTAQTNHPDMPTTSKSMASTEPVSNSSGRATGPPAKSPDAPSLPSTAKSSPNLPSAPPTPSLPNPTSGIGASRWSHDRSPRPSATRPPPGPGPQIVRAPSELSHSAASQSSLLSTPPSSSRPATSVPTPPAPQQAPATTSTAPAPSPGENPVIDDPAWKADPIAYFNPDMSPMYRIDEKYITAQAALRKTIQYCCTLCHERAEIPWRISPNGEFYILEWEVHKRTCTATKGDAGVAGIEKSK